jgi:hypothetical protein
MEGFLVCLPPLGAAVAWVSVEMEGFMLVACGNKAPNRVSGFFLVPLSRVDASLQTRTFRHGLGRAYQSFYGNDDRTEVGLSVLETIVSKNFWLSHSMLSFLKRKGSLARGLYDLVYPASIRA